MHTWNGKFWGSGGMHGRRGKVSERNCLGDDWVSIVLRAQINYALIISEGEYGKKRLLWFGWYTPPTVISWKGIETQTRTICNLMIQQSGSWEETAWRVGRGSKRLTLILPPPNPHHVFRSSNKYSLTLSYRQEHRNYEKPHHKCFIQMGLQTANTGTLRHGMTCCIISISQLKACAWQFKIRYPSILASISSSLLLKGLRIMLNTK